MLSRFVRLGSVVPVLGRFAAESVLEGARGRVLRRSRFELEAGRRITPFEDRDLGGVAELRPVELRPGIRTVGLGEGRDVVEGRPVKRGEVAEGTARDGTPVDPLRFERLGWPVERPDVRVGRRDGLADDDEREDEDRAEEDGREEDRAEEDGREEDRAEEDGREEDRAEEDRAEEDGREVRDVLLERLGALDAVDRFGGSLDSARFGARTRDRQARQATRRFRFRIPLPEALILWIRLRFMIASFRSWWPDRNGFSVSSDADRVPIGGFQSKRWSNAS